MYTDIDECASGPCSNGGACTDLVDRFTCDCVAGYDGITCDSGKLYIKSKQVTFLHQNTFKVKKKYITCCFLRYYT